MLIDYSGRLPPQDAINFYLAAGYNDHQIEDYKSHTGSFGKMVSPLPESYHRLSDGEDLSINNRHWQVVVGSGHSPEHACLYCPELKLLISGDQVLPRITSNISLYPANSDGNPLADWLNSCIRLQELLPDDLLVLPAHQEPFHGLHHRLFEIIESHQVALDRLMKHLERPSTAIDCIPVMFKRKIGSGLLWFATGETLAHLNYLEQQGDVCRTMDESGVHLYRKV
jgi:glyoxylase-like metal-dependent hydrolase (beta-lactamase superfamily II)